MFVDAKCKNCGLVAPFDYARDLMYCCYCGARLTRTDILLASDTPDTTPKDAPVNVAAAATPNLIVTYHSKHQDEPMLIIVCETKERISVLPEQTVSIRLSKGKHKVFFKMHNKQYLKALYIDENAISPIRIDASYGFCAKLDIKYPSSVLPN